MKAEELMIGDWYYWESEGKMYPYQATAEDFVKGETPNFHPIPLTPKILEKNSFLKVEAIEYPSHRVGISFLYRNTTEGLRIFVQNACVDEPTCTMIKTCKYAHELKHILKMCDIEEEIVL